jgi:long-chain fatty acid transport protein
MSRRNDARAVVAIAVALSALVGAAAKADEYHYNNIIVGDRSVGVAGAYIGVSDDPSGLYYNPAGIVYTQGRNFSASANAYHRSTALYPDVLAGNGYDRESSALLPNFFGVTQPIGPGVFGFSYAVPDTSTSDQDQEFNNIPTTLGGGNTMTRYVINFNETDNTYLIGPSYAMEVQKGLSVGATLYFHKRERQTINNQIINLQNAGPGGTFHQWLNSYYQVSESGLRPTLGMMWSPLEKWAFGLTVSRVFVLDSQVTSQSVCTGECGGVGVTTPQVSTVVSNEKRNHPLMIGVGAAWFPSELLMVTADLTYYGETEASAVDHKKEMVVNFAAGVEYYFEHNWAVRAGVFTNMANTSPIVAGNTDQPENVDLYGGTLSLTRFSGNSSTTLGFAYSMGSGQAQLFGGSPTVQDVDRTALMVFLSASYSY